MTPIGHEPIGHESIGDEPIGFEATTTLDDQMVAAIPPVSGRKLDRRRWQRLALYAALICGGAGIGLMGGDDPLAVMRALGTTTLGLQLLLAIAAVGGLAYVGLRLMRRAVGAYNRRTCAEMRRRHPSVDPRDPALRMTRSYHFDATGMTTTTSSDELWLSWTRITGLDETPHLMIVRTGTAVSYPIPKADLSADMQARLTTFVAAHSHSKWPF